MMMKKKGSRIQGVKGSSEMLKALMRSLENKPLTPRILESYPKKKAYAHL